MNATERLCPRRFVVCRWIRRINIAAAPSLLDIIERLKNITWRKQRMRKIRALCLFGVLAFFSWACRKESSSQFNEPARKTTRIGIVSIIEHPLLEDARRGFVQTMADGGFHEGTNVVYDYRNAQGRIENASAIAAAFAGKQFDLIFSIATPSSQAVKEKISNTPIVFAAVTDPLAAHLVAALDKPGGNITGVSDRIPVRYQLELIKDILPLLRRLGVPFNAGEANSVSLVGEMKKLAPEFGIEIVEATASQTAEVSQCVLSLVPKCDAIYMPTDNTMAAAVNVISDIATRNRMPFFSCEDKTIQENGALASLIVNHYELGAEAARMAIRILNDGTDPGTIPVKHLSNPELTINLTVARNLRIEIPADIRKRAKIIQ